MQRVLRRSAQAKDRIRRKGIKIAQVEKGAEIREAARTHGGFHAERTRLESKATKQWKEDFRLGTMAPNRGKESTYGTVPESLTRHPDRAPSRIKLINVGQPLKHATLFVPGDRVMVKKGGQAGKIGVVQESNEGHQWLRLEDTNKAYVHFPDWFLEDSKMKGQPNSTPVDIPLSWSTVKLIHKIGDKDVVIERMLSSKYFRAEDLEIPYKDRPSYVHRVVPGTDITIPDPRLPPQGEQSVVEPTEEEEKKYLESDTFRLEAEKYTWTPTLTTAPMPLTVIDELRQKYAQHRTRHTDEFVQEKLKIDERRDIIAKSSEIMTRTPRKEFTRKLRQEVKEEAKKKTLAPESIALLEEFMKKNAGISGKPATTVDPQKATTIRKTVQQLANAGNPRITRLQPESQS